MKKIILTLIVVFLLQNITAQTTYILCGKLIDVKSGEITSKKTIIVKDNKILDVMDGYVLPKSATAITIDLKDKVIMPGLIDFHVHIEQEFNRNTRLNKYILNEADVALNSVGFAKTTLLNGFTTVRDLGGSGVNTSVCWICMTSCSCQRFPSSKNSWPYNFTSVYCISNRNINTRPS